MIGLSFICVTAMAVAGTLKELDLDIGPDAVTRATPLQQDVPLPSHMREAKKRPSFMVVPGLENIALYKEVTADTEPVTGELEQLTDGIKKSSAFDVVEGPTWIQIDLEKTCEIHAIAIWHYYKNAIVPNDVIVQVSDDPNFTKNVITLFNNDHDNSSKIGKGKDSAYYSRWWGEIVDARGKDNKGTRAQYVRLYTAGSTTNERSQYVEIAVYGKLADKSPLFAFCMDTHDTEKRTLQQQADLLRELDYSGAGHLWLKDIPERLDTLDAAGLKLYQIYLRVDIGPNNKRPYDPRLEEILPLLKGRDVAIALIMNGRGRSDIEGDPRAVEIIREIADMTSESAARVVLYPHVNNWLERVEDAVRVVKKVDRPNVGVMFNLCHWLKIDEEKNMKPLLESAMPYLFAVSIHGADTAVEIRTGEGNWLQPLDSGSFDTLKLLKTLKEMGYDGPIGLQCYGIQGDARVHLERSMLQWRRLCARLSQPSSGR